MSEFYPTDQAKPQLGLFDLPPLDQDREEDEGTPDEGRALKCRACSHSLSGEEVEPGVCDDCAFADEHLELGQDDPSICPECLNSLSFSGEGHSYCSDCEL